MILEQLGTSARVALGAFSVLAGALGLAPEALPVGFGHLVPDLDSASRGFLYAHFAGSTLLALSGVWLMFGSFVRCAGVLALSLLGFYVLLVQACFAVPPGWLVGFGLFCAGVLLYMVSARWRLDLQREI